MKVKVGRLDVIQKIDFMVINYLYYFLSSNYNCKRLLQVLYTCFVFALALTANLL